MTAATHHLDIYEVDLHLVTSKREWKRLQKRLSFMDRDAPDSLGQSQLAIWHPNAAGPPEPINVFWIDMARHDTEATLIDSCAHEASHAAAQILHWIGHNIIGSEGISEPHAYLVGWLTKWLWSNTHHALTDG